MSTLQGPHAVAQTHMRLALALAALCATAAARQDHLCAEDVCFYHIPKTGGDSFKYLLRRIPSEDIRRRQSIIRKHGHRLQYAVDDLGEEPDAVETLFVGALGLAHDLAHLYQV